MKNFYAKAQEQRNIGKVVNRSSEKKEHWKSGTAGQWNFRTYKHWNSGMLTWSISAQMN